jgi:hypothetical protein
MNSTYLQDSSLQAESEKDAISSLRPPFTLAVNEAVAPWTFIRSSKRLNTLHTHR